MKDVEEASKRIWDPRGWYLYPKDREGQDASLVTKVNTTIKAMLSIEKPPSADEALKLLK